MLCSQYRRKTKDDQEFDQINSNEVNLKNLISKRMSKIIENLQYIWRITIIDVEAVMTPTY